MYFVTFLGCNGVTQTSLFAAVTHVKSDQNTHIFKKLITINYIINIKVRV